MAATGEGGKKLSIEKVKKTEHRSEEVGAHGRRSEVVAAHGRKKCMSRLH